MIPKIVYTFWDGEMDVYERACLQNLRDTNPDFDVVLLSSDNVENKPINYDELSRQAKSDWARVEAVERTGGFGLTWRVSCLNRSKRGWISIRICFTGLKCRLLVQL